MPSSHPRSYTPEQRAEAIALYEQVGPREAGKRLGIPKSTIEQWAKRAGARTVQPSCTREAVEAAKTKRARAREALAAGLLEDALKMREQLFAETKVYNFGGKDNTFAEAKVPEPCHRDKQALVNAILGAAKAALELERFDHDDSAERTALVEWLKVVRGAS